MADPFRLVFDRSALDKLLESQTGPIGLDLAKRAAKTANSARRRAPKRTGRLRGSIRWELGADEEGLYADIGTLELYGKFQESGHVAANGRRVAPRRYLRPALRAVRSGR